MSPRPLLHCVLPLVVGCGSSSPRPATTAPPRAVAPTSVTAPARPARDPACASAGAVALFTPPLALVCQNPDSFHPGSCTGTTRIQVINCTLRTVQLIRVEVDSADGARFGRVTFNFNPQLIGPGERYERRTSVLQRAGRFRFTAHLGPTPMTVQSELEVTNPMLDQAEAKCRACRGRFAGHGMSGRVFCLCRMPDAGKPCTDGDQCQGKCASTGEGYRCSEHRTVFGCHSYLPRGWSRQPRTRMGRRVPHICVD